MLICIRLRRFACLFRRSLFRLIEHHTEQRVADFHFANRGFARVCCCYLNLNFIPGLIVSRCGKAGLTGNALYRLCHGNFRKHRRIRHSRSVCIFLCLRGHCCALCKSRCRQHCYAQQYRQHQAEQPIGKTMFFMHFYDTSLNVLFP